MKKWKTVEHYIVLAILAATLIGGPVVMIFGEDMGLVKVSDDSPDPVDSYHWR